MTILTAAPTLGTLVGRAEDRGSDSSITGRAPGVTSVFVTPASPRAIEAYYQSTYRRYRLSEDCCATAHRIQLVGGTASATVGIDITTGRVSVPAHYSLHLTAAPHAAKSWAVVTVTGAG